VGEFCDMIWAYLGDGEPPVFPPFPAFEGQGFIECFRQHFPCNYFQSTENDWDLYHARYTHGTGGIHTIDYDALVASEQYQETEFGVVRRFAVPGGGTASSVFFMPTALRFTLPANNEIIRSGLGPLRRPSYGITVPIDDRNCYFYLAEFVGLTGAAADQYRERFGDVQEIRDRKPTPIEISQLIRTTTMSVKDAIDHPALVAVEDLCAQVGQGEIADRDAEFLGRTDRGIIFMRRIWQRELEALSEGRPTKAWAFMPEMPK
jgi:5,5'-dehydrodivanillate O-demethylase